MGCVLCSDASETIDNIILSCSYSKSIGPKFSLICSYLTFHHRWTCYGTHGDLTLLIISKDEALMSFYKLVCGAYGKRKIKESLISMPTPLGLLLKKLQLSSFPGRCKHSKRRFWHPLEKSFFRKLWDRWILSWFKIDREILCYNEGCSKRKKK